MMAPIPTDLIMAAEDITTLLVAWRNGRREAYDDLFSRVYEELRRLAHRYMEGERTGHTLTTTELVHEAYVKLIDVKKVDWQDRVHFYAMAARAMRRILVSYARRHAAVKRGGGAAQVSLEEMFTLAQERSGAMLELDAALEKLAELDQHLSRVVELRFFGGLTIEESAALLGVGPTTVKSDWRKARAWLYRELRA